MTPRLPDHVRTEQISGVRLITTSWLLETGNVLDRQLASVVAEELRQDLRRRASEMSGPAYAFALWSNGEYGELGVSLAIEGVARHTPPVAGKPTPALDAPADDRWNNWDPVAERFVTERTQELLDQLRDVMDEAGFRCLHDPSETNLADFGRALRRWQRLTNEVIANAEPLSLLPVTPDAVAWVEFPNYDRPVEHAMSMTLTNDRAVLGRLFPHWRHLCAALDGMDPGILSRLRDFREAAPLGSAERCYREDPILAIDLEQALIDCGFTWWDLAGWDGAHVPADYDADVPNAGTDHKLALAYVVAERIG